MRKPTEIFMSFAADETMLEDIRRSIRDAITDVNLGNKEKNGILLAIEEACTNVVRHAYLYGPGTIRIKVKILPNKVIFSIFDKGRQFDFNRTDTPDLERYVKTGRKGGLGLYLIRKMMDSVDYYSRDGENELRMSKSVALRQKIAIMPRGMTIRLKFAMWASLVVFLIAAAISYYFDFKNSKSIRERFFGEAINIAQTTALNALDKIVVGNELELSGLAKSALDGNPYLRYVTIVDINDLIWADALNPQNLLSEYSFPAPLDSSQVDIFQHYYDEDHGYVFHLTTNVLLDSQKLGAIHFGFSEEGLARQLAQSRESIIIFALLGIIVGLGAVYLLSYYFVKPIQKLTEGVLKIGQGNLEEALPVDGTDEFSEIARAFNEITSKFKKAQNSVIEKELLQKEMQVAQEIQHALLPNKFPEIDGYELSAVYRAAKDVGGDYFDFVWIDENSLGIAVADVSGKGVPGSLVMTMIRTAIRLEARGNSSPSEILAKVNNFVADDVKKGMFITIFFIILDSEKRQISFSSAGHNPMILYRKDTDKCYFLNPKGMPLGLTLPDDITFGGALQADKLKLKKDDMLIVYTDGITEAMNNLSEQYGNDRLINFIKTNSHLSPDEFAKALDKDLTQFTGNAPQNDDITLVVIKEKIMVDELILEKRKRLLSLVEDEKMSIEEACKTMGVSVTTYYKYRKRHKEQGDSGLLNKNLRAQAVLKQIPYNVRMKILEIIRDNPEFGAARICRKLAEIGENYTDKNIYDELVGMRLNTRRLRLAHVERVGQLKPEQKQLLEKEILRDEKREFDRTQYAEDLKKNIEKRQVEQISSETGKVISQLKKLGPNADSGNIYNEIARELEKLDGGAEVSQMFTSMISKMKEGSADEIKRPAKSDTEVDDEIKVVVNNHKPTKPVIVATSSDEAIVIDKKAIKRDDDNKSLSDIAEYEKKLMKRFQK